MKHTKKKLPEVDVLLKNLINIESTTGNEKNALSYIEKVLSNLDLKITKIKVTDNRYNLLAVKGKPEILLSTHIDTVPPFIPHSKDDKFIYGRGACDAKGLIAAMIKATEKLTELKINNFGLLFVVGEEIDSVGAKKANEILSGKVKYFINGEPTENKLALGHKGIFTFKLKAKGKAGHSAYPETGNSAIHNLINVLTKLEKLKFNKNKILGNCTLNIGVINGGRAPNVIADEASATIGIRVVNSTLEIEKKINSIIKIEKNIEMEILYRCEPVFTHYIEGFKKTFVSYSTDLPNVKKLGIPLLYGPGSILDAHTSNEKIRIKDLFEAVDTYKNLVIKLKQGK